MKVHIYSIYNLFSEKQKNNVRLKPSLGTYSVHAHTGVIVSFLEKIKIIY